METKSIIKNWYYKLDFPKSMDKDFEMLLSNTSINTDLSIEDYDEYDPEGGKNLLYFLYFCESLSKKYKEKGIPENILIDTLKDIPIWTKTWSDLKGELYLGELFWLNRHLGMKLFKLGRLQFCIGDSRFDIPEYQIKKGSPVIQIHIPEGEPLSQEACIKSLDMARDFFERYFPEYKYTVFTCHSWLLDSSLKNYLKSDSNILKFAKLFNITQQDPSDGIFGFLFKWGIKREELADITPSSSFASKIKTAAMDGAEFHAGFGFIVK